MTIRNSSASARSGKPNKPFPEFPLFPHATKRWAKKIRGSLVYFGPWDDPDAALKKYEAQKEDLHAGRKPKEQVSAGVTVKDIANAFLIEKQARLNSGDIAKRTWQGYKETADMIVAQFGKNRLAENLGPEDFAALRNYMAKKWGPVRVRNFIQQVRSVFKHALEAGLLTSPVRFGPGFKRPTRKTLRIERAKQGPKMFEPDEVRALVDGALVVGKDGPTLVMPTPALRAMILLGVNCGYGNADCGTLPRSVLDLSGGWVTYPRPKTGINRRCPLWPETAAALKAVLDDRREPKDPKHSELVFITQTGGTWHKETGDNPISKEMRKYLDSLGINGHRNFYALRHTFETIGGEAKDQVAVDHIMGHARDDMASVYRERISDERLKAVSDFVRKWVFGS